MENYKEIAKKARIKILKMIFDAQTSHIGSNFSCVDIMAVLFDKIDLEKDKFILSAGWKAATLYYFLWKKGRITEEELNSYCQPGSKFIGLAEPVIPEIPFAGGSMCMGLAAGVGFALSKKLKGEDGTIYVLESDGGMNGGITWEAIMLANQYGKWGLDNLVLTIDKNGYQAMGETKEIINMGELKTKLRNFGWSADEIDGHNYERIEFSLNQPQFGPKAIIANTVKGKGVPFMENNNLYHYKNLSEEEYNLALKGLNG